MCRLMIPILLLLCVLRGPALRAQETLPLRVDSATDLRIRRYFTTQPADTLVCFFGERTGTDIVVDSSVLVPACDADVHIGGFAYVRNMPPDSATRAAVVQHLCLTLSHFPHFLIVGLITDIETHVAADGTSVRVPKVLACWRAS